MQNKFVAGVCKHFHDLFAPMDSAQINPNESIENESDLEKSHSSHPRPSREMWPSRAAFLLAAIGSSVGLGNIWRFPALAYKWGGGAFFVPYLLALFLIGIPLTALELSLGKLFRSGDVVSFSRVNHRLRGLGLASVTGSWMINTFYCVIMAWIMVYFFNSFQSPLPWMANGGTDAAAYFKNTILMMPTDGRTYPPTIIVAQIFGCLLLVWSLIYLSLWKGVTLTGKITYVTMTLPVILIIVLFARSVSLPGAGEGIMLYIGQFNAANLANPLMWSEAVGQIFFSIGIGFGVFTAYASYNSKFQNTTVDAILISCSNSVYEFFCGFCVFAIAGYLQYSGKAIKPEDVMGVALAFATYPVAFASLPAPQFWCVLFFLMLFVLGIDSAFSLIEAGATVLMDSRAFGKKPRELVVAAMCIAGVLIGILFCSEVGSYAIDAVDYFVNNVAIVFVGMMECIGVSFMYRFHQVKDQVGLTPLIISAVTFFSGLILGVSLVYTINIWVGIGLGLTVMIAGFVASVLAVRYPMPLSLRAWWIAVGNIELLRRDINASDTKGHVRMPIVWSLVIKFICVPLLFVMLCFPFADMATASPSVPSAYRWLGISAAVIILLFIFLGLAMPRWFLWAMPDGEERREFEVMHEIDDAVVEEGQECNGIAMKAKEGHHHNAKTAEKTDHRKNESSESIITDSFDSIESI